MNFNEIRFLTLPTTARFP